MGLSRDLPSKRGLAGLLSYEGITSVPAFGPTYTTATLADSAWYHCVKFLLVFPNSLLFIAADHYDEHAEPSSYRSGGHC